MKNTADYKLILERNDITIQAVIALIGVLREMEMTSLLVANEDKSGLIEIVKEARPVGLDYSAFEETFFSWHFCKEKTKTLTLTIQQSIIYWQMWQIAMTYLKHQDYESGLNIEAMKRYYAIFLTILVETQMDGITGSEENFRLN